MTGKGRRTIMGGDAPSYRGPEQIQEYYDSANLVIKRKVRGIVAKQKCPYPEDSQRTFLTLWAGGFREGESIMIDPKGWKWTADSLGYQKAPVLKKREKVRDPSGKPIYKKVTSRVIQQDGSIQDEIIYRPLTKQKIEYREHIIPRDMPLVEEYIKIIQSLQEQGYRYMLYKNAPFQRVPIPHKPCSETTVQSRIDELHPELFPHGIRALHARYLRKRYGKDRFDTPELKQHFKWSSTEMAVYYLSGQDLADAMDITKPW